MSEGIDPGLDELVADQIGPADATTDTPTETAAPAESQEASPANERTDQVAEAAQAQPDATAAAQPPSQPAEQTVEINGQKYTLAQVQAAFTTAEQFRHLQPKYVEQKRWIESQQAQQQQRPAQQLDPKTVQRNIRASFDASAEQAVKDGNIEPDFAALYPDVTANLIMYRDTLTAVASVATQLNQKVQQYEQQIAGERVVHEVKNNMAALSSQHPAFQPLADPTVRDQFFEYLVQIDPKVDQLQDPQFLIGHWVAFKRNDFLQQAPAQARVAQQVQAQRQVQRRQAVADAVGGSRPTASPPQPKTALDEMVDDMFDRSR